jgi:hypothetical protein
MRKSSLQLYSVTFLFILALSSISLAGDTQCPDDPPPPVTPPPTPSDDGGRMSPGGMLNNDNVPEFIKNSPYLKSFVEFLDQATGLL